MATQRDPPSIPSHSLHFSGSITYMSPSLIAVFGHSGRQSPQAVHSSVILIAIKLTSLPLFFVFSSTSIKSFHKYTKIKVGLSIIISSGVSLFFLAPPLYAEGRVEKPSRSCGNCRQYPAPREIFPPLAEFR